jgi:hypothetical protein
MSTTAIRAAIAAVAVAVIVVFLVIVTGDQSAGPERGVTLADVLDDPEEYLGRTVTVSGEVDRLVIGARAFTIGDRLATTDEDDLLVIPRQSARAGAEAVDVASVVRVEGVVRRFTTPVEDDDLLFDDEEDDALDEFEGEPAIVVTDIELVPAQ